MCVRPCRYDKQRLTSLFIPVWNWVVELRLPCPRLESESTISDGIRGGDKTYPHDCEGTNQGSDREGAEEREISSCQSCEQYPGMDAPRVPTRSRWACGRILVQGLRAKRLDGRHVQYRGSECPRVCVRQ